MTTLFDGLSHDEMKELLNKALNGHAYYGWCHHCESPQIIEEYNCGDSVSYWACRQCETGFSPPGVQEGDQLTEGDDIPF